MIDQKNSAVWFKINGLLRYVLMHAATQIFPLYIVNEYPKSGGSWVGEMLSDALKVPFPRNRLPMLKSSILHGHIMQAWNMRNVLIVWRDGRDVLISQYHHYLFENDRCNKPLVAQSRADLGFSDYQNVECNLPAFMKYVFERKRHPKMSWTEFVSRWANCKNCVHVKYEDLREKPAEELIRIVRQLADLEMSNNCAGTIIDRHSFERLSGRKSGKENIRSFMRKGIVGDWKLYFSHDARVLFDHYAGKQLIMLGYEKDSSWIDGNIRR